MYSRYSPAFNIILFSTTAFFLFLQNLNIVFLCLYLQEEIKILRVSVFVNPYTEPDEEEEKAKDEEEKKKDEDYVMLHFISCFTYSHGRFAFDLPQLF